MAFNKSMRIRVLIDVRKPLLQKAKLKLRGVGEVVVDVKYGRLPLFYYYYGTIRHDTKDCDRSFYTESPEKRYGEWLKYHHGKIKMKRKKGIKINKDLVVQKSFLLWNQMIERRKQQEVKCGW
ncbi:Methylthioribose-1-phosphate isomerase [Bienertia sinuspersici]